MRSSHHLLGIGNRPIASKSSEMPTSEWLMCWRMWQLAVHDSIGDAGSERDTSESWIHGHSSRNQTVRR